MLWCLNSHIIRNVYGMDSVAHRSSILLGPIRLHLSKVSLFFHESSHLAIFPRICMSLMTWYTHDEILMKWKTPKVMRVQYYQCKLLARGTTVGFMGILLFDI